MDEKGNKTGKNSMIKFNHKLSLMLDEATHKAEQGLPMWATIKRILEFIIFGA